VQHLAVKAAVAEVTDLGEFTAIAAVFGNVDRDGDRIVKGAFADSIEAWQSAGRSVPLHWNHSSDPDDIIGFVDPGSMVETGRGLVVDGQLDLGDSDRARRAWRAMKTNSIGLSFGYVTRKQRRAVDGANELLAIDLFEVSLTPAPANADTRILSMKAAEHHIPTDAELRAKAKQLGIEPPPSRRELRRHADDVALQAALGWEPPPDPTLPTETGPTARELRRQCEAVALDAALGWPPLPSPEPDEQSVPTADELRRRSAELGLSVPPNRSRDLKAVKLEARKRMLEVLGVSEEEVARWGS
jgi:HK97 family phage prohead protease